MGSKLIHLFFISAVTVCMTSCHRLKRGYDDYHHGVETIDLGRPEARTQTIRFPQSVRTVRVTKTVAVPVPVPYPIRRDVPVPVHVSKPVPVPVPYQVPVPVAVPHGSLHQQQQEASPVGLIIYDAGRSLGGSGYGSPSGGYDAFTGATGSTGATIGHHEGSIGVVVGASYGVSAPAGSDQKYRGTVVNESVGVNDYASADTSGHGGNQGQVAYSYPTSYQSSGNGAGQISRGSDNYSITKSIEANYDGSDTDSGVNSIQHFSDNRKGN